MNVFQSKHKVFIVRVWLEPREISGGPVIWRGVIEEVSEPAVDEEPGAKGQPPRRVAFQTLGALLDYLTVQLKELGVPADQLPR